MGKSPRSKKRTGICKLTRTHGVFVDSHIIPKAFNKPEQPGLPLLQYNSGAAVRVYFSFLSGRLDRACAPSSFRLRLYKRLWEYGVGQNESLLIPTVTYEGSYQKINMELVLSESTFG